MRFRFIIFSILFLATTMAAITLILLLTGVFHFGRKEIKTLFENEFNHKYNDIYSDFGNISANGIDLSRTLNRSIEDKLVDKKIEAAELKNHPEIYNELLDSVCQTLVAALLRTKSSAVFIILDGTINPDLPYAEQSRAGLYIRNMEPNVVNLESPSLHMIRGSTEIAKRNKISIHPQWAMEFDISVASCFTRTIGTARAFNTLPVSKLYCWYSGTVLPEMTDKAMLCLIPLIASDGTVYGICGFEVSSLLFKLSYTSENPAFDSSFCLLAPFSNGMIDCSSSFVAARYPAITRNEIADAKLRFQQRPSTLTRYFSPSKEFMGIHKTLTLYPNDSPYLDEEWVVSIMVPSKDYTRTIGNLNLKIALLFFFLFITGIIVSFRFSRIYLKTMTETFNKIKSTKPSDVEKTNIPEIDDLLEFLAEQDRKNALNTPKNEAVSPEYQNTDMFRKFLQNIKTLSPAEKAVFDLYMECLTGKEIAERLFLSINTIKTHNKRIYEKLNVSSRNELMVYLRMMKEANIES
ncbi:MAG TPA: hypothetical protein GX501_02405 [Clostridiaceae bacterium]|nr:hypothetical protein [Clostridiaceae bacterium]